MKTIICALANDVIKVQVELVIKQMSILTAKADINFIALPLPQKPNIWCIWIYF